ncbi:bifunctional nuclease family protein [candidate division WOR-3 bacterium]|nr:bifunctional nuclease family protein [candidate division WOR-3 bacterium]
MVEAKISGLAYDTISNMPVIFLKEVDGKRILPIWIGPNEASSIAIAIEHLDMERPLTHDLIKNIIKGLNAEVTKVVVNEIRGSTYYARIYLKCGNSITEIDARPSDSIAIALRSSAPIYMSESVLENGSTFTLKEGETLRRHFEQLKLEDFGKFKL